MMPMFLTVYLSNSDKHFTELPITPETLCRDVVDMCKEPGEVDCYLAEMWRGSERVIGDSERIIEVLQRWGQQRAEVRFFLRHDRAPGHDTGGHRAPESLARRNAVKGTIDRHMENGMAAPHMDITLSELQEMASRQQQQINAQQQLLATKEQRLRFLKLQDQRQQHQQESEQEKLRLLRENAENQEAKLRRVRALKGQVEQKRISNSKLVEEIEQMNGLFQQKQRELVVAVSRVEELSRQLDMLRGGKMDVPHEAGPSSSGELERLYKELQLRNKLNQEQSAKLQQQRENLNKRNVEMAAMDKRVAELRERLWKKKAALQQKENLPQPSEGQSSQPMGPSRVAAVGPYIQTTPAPPVPPRQEILVKPAYPDGTATLPKPLPKPTTGIGFLTSKISKVSDLFSNTETNSNTHGHSSTLPRMTSHGSQEKDFEADLKPPPLPLRKNQSSEDLLRDTQSAGRSFGKVPPPVPSKPKPALPGQSTFSKPPYSTGTFPGKARPATQKPPVPLPSHNNTLPLPLPPKPDTLPAATVRPFTTDTLTGKENSTPTTLHKPQTVAARSIYSMYTQQSTLGKGYQGQSTLTRSQPRLYGKPVIPSSGGQQSLIQDSSHLEKTGGLDGDQVDQGNNMATASSSVEGQEVERAPRPLSPTKLLPFLSNSHRLQSDADLEALRKRLHHAPRPLKKRGSITESEGPGGPNIQKLLYQKTTLAAMETTITPAAFFQAEGEDGCRPVADENTRPHEGHRDTTIPECEKEEEDLTPPPLPPRSPILEDSSIPSIVLKEPPLKEEQEVYGPAAPEPYVEEYPPYPPPPYPSMTEQEGTGEDSVNMKAPEVTGQVMLPPGKRTNLRKTGSERINHGMRVRFNPLALLLDSSLEGEYDLVQRIIYEVEDPSLPNDEGITALHNAVCAGHTEIVKFLVQFGVNVNAADSDGWTPLHCAASCNNVQVCKFLVESGAAVYATTYSDMQTAADKCEEMEEGYAQCSQFLYGVQEKMGIMNRGVVYALWDYDVESLDELSFKEGDCLTVLRREDSEETEWWWARCADNEGYIPRNLLGLYPRIKPRQRSLA
ncbi:apoptosis-stimulating of p53 protein 2b isoform X1 [Puntigrus tetrazona]|uniref:apoptosis-stimulating of p53 protein 2b isoform X1 n=1 Tax=Puntigrus tetrazona TaxID=1606681 RepID=UPI001C8A647F|nr:apoptosis-stimulating of p53 protein 2b isoform X1 [Puntigrus tetrazona]